MERGILYLVATPIGNLDDMTIRAVQTLKDVDIIAAEDTRNSIKLLNHFEIKTPMTSYHEFNRYDKAEYLTEQLLMGKSVAVITDAGTPGISDPGEVLVDKCIELGIRVVPVPGAVAAVNALISSGQPTRRFCFEAFLPRDKKERLEVLEELRDETRTIVLYEAPHRLKKTLAELSSVLGTDRSMSICRELTKRHETVERRTIGDFLERYETEEPRGEYVLVIHGLDMSEKKQRQESRWQEMSIEEHLQMYIDEGLERNDAMKAVARDRGISKREVYQQTMRH